MKSPNIKAAALILIGIISTQNGSGATVMTEGDAGDRKGKMPVFVACDGHRAPLQRISVIHPTLSNTPPPNNLPPSYNAQICPAAIARCGRWKIKRIFPSSSGSNTAGSAFAR